MNIVWWASPKVLSVFFLSVLSLFFVFGQESAILSDKNFILKNGLFYLIVFIFIFFLGSLLFDFSDKESHGRKYMNFDVSKGLDRLFYLSILGFLLRFYELFLNPQIILDILFGDLQNSRGFLTPIEGTGLLTQFAAVYSSLYFIDRRCWRTSNKIKHTYFLSILFCFVIFKTLVWSERLAIIEFCIPGLIYFGSLSAFSRNVVSLAPFSLPIFFGVTEYFRSWKFYRASYSSFVDFALDRFYAYYYSAVSNGYELWNRTGFEPYFANIWSWWLSLPYVGSVFNDFLSPRSFTYDYLSTYATLEFNTFTGIFPLFIGFSMFGSFFLALVSGFYFQKIFYAFTQGIHSRPVIFYPFVLIGILEILRINYFLEGRFLAILISILVIPKIRG